MIDKNTCDTCTNKGYIYSNDIHGNDEVQKCDSCNTFQSDKAAQLYQILTNK